MSTYDTPIPYETFYTRNDTYRVSYDTNNYGQGIEQLNCFNTNEDDMIFESEVHAVLYSLGSFSPAPLHLTKQLGAAKMPSSSSLSVVKIYL